MAADDYPEILDSALVAEMLKMNVQVVRRLTREGALPAYRLPGGRTYRYFKSEVVEWLRSHRIDAPAAELEDTPD